MNLRPRFHQPDDKPEQNAARQCELEQCDEALPVLPGREGQNRYCSREHKSEAHKRRLRDKFG